jgi:mRNA-degrading endonuclease toxin of MazEF toxin-antitoxin module
VVLSKDSYNRHSEDFIAIPLTSNLKAKDYTLLITNKELESGRLITKSKAKADRVFRVSQSLIRMKVGRLRTDTYDRLVGILLELIGAA